MALPWSECWDFNPRELVKTSELWDREGCDRAFQHSRFPDEFPALMSRHMDILSRICHVSGHTAVDHLKHGRCD